MSSDAAAIVELKSVFAIQTAAFLKDQYPSVESRRGDLQKLAGALMKNRENIRDALSKDFMVHNAAFSEVVETLGPAGRAMWVAEQVEKWMADEEREVDAQLFGDSKAYIRWEPKGVVGALSPFNFPFELAIGPLCEQLAAGNRVILKPSELAPESAAVIKKLINETFPRDKVEVILGGVELATEFSKLPWNHLMYTGSPAIGKVVMKAAAENLVPVTLELGGKSPAIVLPGAINEVVIQSIVGTKMIKSGQNCCSVDTVWVHKADLDEFVSGAKAFVETLGPYSTSNSCTGLITERHLDRQIRLYEDAKSHGATVIDLEENQTVDRETRQMGVSLVVDPPKGTAIISEEIFGPLLLVLTYDKVEDSVASINKGDRPLGLYVYGEDTKTIDYVLDNTKSGGAVVNSAFLQVAMKNLAFGGSGNSGMGVTHGIEGFREFSNPRGIVRRGTTPVNVFLPPFATLRGIADHVFQLAA